MLASNRKGVSLVNKELNNTLIACHQCDALYEEPIIAEGYKAHCGRCGGYLFEHKKNSIERTLSLSIAGLILMYPAVFLPFIGISVAGQSNQASLYNCITSLMERDFYLIALCVFVFAIAVPFVRLLGAFYISYCLKYNKIKPFLMQFFRAYHHLDSWAMLHVFLLGMVVSMYKLIGEVEIGIDYGLMAYIFLLFSSIFVSITLDQHLVWHTLEEKIGNNYR